MIGKTARLVSILIVVAAGVSGSLLAGDFVGDPSFEAGSPNPSWDETTNIGFPLICDASCGVSGANTGSWFVWMGGFAGGLLQGAVSQDVSLPDKVGATLSFSLWWETCNNTDEDFLKVEIDGFPVWQTDANDPRCDGPGYQEVTVPIESYLASSDYQLEFGSQTVGGGVTSFFLDDVDVELAATERPDLEITGSCPGTVVLSASGGVADAVAGIAWSSTLGSDRMTGGPCAGAITGLSGARAARLGTFDVDGNVSLSVSPPSCGLTLQVFDTWTCQISDTVSLSDL